MSLPTPEWREVPNSYPAPLSRLPDYPRRPDPVPAAFAAALVLLGSAGFAFVFLGYFWAAFSGTMAFVVFFAILTGKNVEYLSQCYAVALARLRQDYNNPDAYQDVLRFGRELAAANKGVPTEAAIQNDISAATARR